MHQRACLLRRALRRRLGDSFARLRLRHEEGEQPAEEELAEGDAVVHARCGQAPTPFSFRSREVARFVESGSGDVADVVNSVAGALRTA